VKAIESGAHCCQLRSIADSHGGNSEQVGGAVGENSSRARETATVRERKRERERERNKIAFTPSASQLGLSRSTHGKEDQGLSSKILKFINHVTTRIQMDGRTG
jgi:hypothetical protein